VDEGFNVKILNNKIKIVIWDLDETFWVGTVSEGAVTTPEKNIAIIKELTRRGIINTISSKNNFDDAKRELEALQVWDYFVFPQISWDPKGKIISDLLETLNLRADNALFIDDNILNLQEALFFSPKLNVSLPEHIDTLLENDYLKGKDDPNHTRLAQYKNLEKKQQDFSKSSLSNVEFLKESDIKVQIKTDCANELDRIYELIERTNQLNYTKNRVSLEELRLQINDGGNTSGYVTVTDKYGDYGISGFYLVKKNELLHFLFSCRTMNMFVESWVYKQIGSPQLKIAGEVALQLDSTTDLSFINNPGNKTTIVPARQITGNKTLLMIGGCDLDQIVYYLNYGQLYTEFNYVNSINLNVHKDHTLLIKQFKDLSKAQLEVISRIPILDVNDVNIKIYTIDWDVLLFSPLNDYSRGLYRHKSSGFILPFDAFSINWTDEANWGNLPRHLSTLPLDFLKFLKKEFTFLGPISAEDFQQNINWMLDTFKDKKFIFLTGSEIIFEKGSPWEKNMHERHILMNEVLRSFGARENVKIIDVTKFVKDEKDITDNIRHYTKVGYKRIADEIASVANAWLNNRMGTKSILYLKLGRVVNKIKSKLKV
jgi:FkbH-like protein